jgi:hypothetical protein
VALDDVDHVNLKLVLHLFGKLFELCE